MPSYCRSRRTQGRRPPNQGHDYGPAQATPGAALSAQSSTPPQQMPPPWIQNAHEGRKRELTPCSKKGLSMKHAHVWVRHVFMHVVMPSRRYAVYHDVSHSPSAPCHAHIWATNADTGRAGGQPSASLPNRRRGGEGSCARTWEGARGHPAGRRIQCAPCRLRVRGQSDVTGHDCLSQNLPARILDPGRTAHS